MNIIQPGPIPVNGNAPATVRRRELVQKVLVEGSIPALERLLVIGVCKSSKFYGRLKELDIAPHVPNGVPGSRRPDFQHPDYARAFPLIADFREGNAGVDAIGPELVDVFLTGIVEQRRLTIEDKERILAWLKPELVEPEWENTGPIFAMLDAPVFREWRYGAVARYELNRLHIQASTETRIVPARDIEAALKNIQEAGRVTRLFPEIIDAVDFQAKKLEEPKQLVQGIWHQGSKLSLGGSSKAFKSWSFYDLAIAIAAGESWLGFKTHKGRVLLVNLEIQDFFSQYRINQICQARGVRLERDQLEILNLRGFAASHEILVPKILDRIRERGQPYSAILLDPTYKLHAPGADENSAVDVGALMNSIDTLAVEAGAGVGFSAHYSKGNQANKEVIDRVSGSGVFARDPDTIINFTAHQQETAYVVEAVLRNFPPVPPFVVRWQFPRMVRESTLDPADLKNKKGGCNQIHDPQEVLDALPEAGLRSCEWEKASGKTNSTFKRSKTLLVAAGLVAKEKGIWKKVQGPEGPKGPIGPSGP